jgi:LysR family glycine cleavage system transcriptional activator
MTSSHDLVAMRRDLPSLSSLEAFEAAARHLSFTRAAADLHVTQGAVSRQVQALEGQLGLPLFQRVRKRIALTEAGEAYLPKVRSCLDRLEAATLQLRAFRGASGVLNLAILPTFGTKWLIPRLPEFLHRHPEVVVNFSTRLGVFDFAEEDLDAAIHYGGPDWPGGVADHLMDEHVVVVASPALCSKHRLKRPADVADLVHLQLASRPGGWREWLDGVGLPGVDGKRGPRFEHHAMVIQAAIAGLGLAVLPRFLCEEELLEGQLVVPFPDAAVRSRAYWLVHPEGRRDLPALVAFRDWLQGEIRKAGLSRSNDG